jgi:hypothetical protein
MAHVLRTLLMAGRPANRFYGNLHDLRHRK